ncbi:E3 ubiquitin-protein ligase MARCH2-like [Mizuhopecten yessoensis]|uniref:E3 ubiquitin-protein ligase 6-Mar n=1 Tax=Mizuhopecten yessoensis TaxID=6573 RepID=A0A210PHW7_MIZYE|nr:E3 ubiquitin-protein ligase MARCH2-like [Mizuhopecten yessoensis]OWF36080.1 E3 ubiquitin-protein ligase 6-Mar [Mizuhopecten yessoensis]
MEISPAEIPLTELGNPRASSEREFGGLNDPQTEEPAATTVSLPKTSEEKDGLEERASLGSRETGCETKENVQSGKDTQQSDIQSLPPSNSSSDENICRICQESSKDTEEPVQTTRCSCKGATARIHRSCLREWVRHQRSVRCEICKGRFEGITPPGSLERAIDRHMDQNYMPAEDITETIHQLYYHLHRLRPFTRRRRAAIAATIVFLALVTCMSAVMTVEADREYRQVSKNPWSTHHAVDQSGIIFSICVASAFFCATLTIGLLVIWAGVECTYHIQRRALYRRVERSMLENMGRHNVINVV